MSGGIARFAHVFEHMQRAVRVDDRDGAERPVRNDRARSHALDRARTGRCRDPTYDAESREVDDGEPRLVVASDERIRRRSGGRQRGTHPKGRGGGQRDELTAIHVDGTAALARQVPVDTLNG